MASESGEGGVSVGDFQQADWCVPQGESKAVEVWVGIEGGYAKCLQQFVKWFCAA